MNNYIKILLYLKQYEGDGKMYPLKEVFSELPSYQLKGVLEELEKENLIHLFIRSQEESLTEKPKSIIDQMLSEAMEYEANITLMGIKYLKKNWE